MAQDKPQFRRRHYFIKKDFQSQIIIKFCLLVLAGAIISTGLLYFFSKDTLTSTFHNSRLVIDTTASIMLPAIISTNLVSLGLIMLATIFVTLFISHKIAGPLFRFEKDLKEIGEGDLTKKIFLRKKDQVTVMADNINIMTANLQKKVKAVHEDIETLIEAIPEKDSPEAVGEELQKIYWKIESEFKF